MAPEPVKVIRIELIDAHVGVLGVTVPSANTRLPAEHDSVTSSDETPVTVSAPAANVAVGGAMMVTDVVVAVAAGSGTVF